MIRRASSLLRVSTPCRVPSRFKSTDTTPKEDFALAREPDSQFVKWTDEITHESLPLKMFLAQHRPLLPVLPRKHLVDSALETDEIMFVPVWHPTGRQLLDTHVQGVPHLIANDLGPFDVATKQFKPAVVRTRPPSVPVIPENDMLPQVKETLNILASFLDKYNTDDFQSGKPAGKPADKPAVKSAGKQASKPAPKPALIHLPLHGGSSPYVDVDGEQFDIAEISATSVRRKRKLKMNRHKYRKRLKAQRTLRRRLGK